VTQLHVVCSDFLPYLDRQLKCDAVDFEMIFFTERKRSSVASRFAFSTLSHRSR
jgi:hypothetical protein